MVKNLVITFLSLTIFGFILYHLGVFENLNSAELNACILNVNPAVGHVVVYCFYFCFFN